MAFKFSYVCDLFQSLEDAEAAQIPLSRKQKRDQCHDITTQWFCHHRGLIDAHRSSLSALLSCLLPERRPERKYGLQHTRLANHLAHALGLPVHLTKQLRVLTCDLEFVNRFEYLARERHVAARSPVLISEIEACLAQLAAVCRHSSPKVRSALDRALPVDQRSIIKPIPARLPARDLKWFIRILFKRLGTIELNENLVFRHIHPWFPAIMKLQSNFEVALRTLESHELAQCGQVDPLVIPQAILGGCLKPLPGVKIARPSYFKIRSIKHCIQQVGSAAWDIEPKYDGEYCQIHVLLENAHPRIHIFSKSGRESTMDRLKLLPVLKECLKLSKKPNFERQCILEGEMVVFDDRDNSILPFHKIRRHAARGGSFRGAEHDSFPTPHEHLGIIFYDLLLLDDQVVMHQPHRERRRQLRRVVTYLPGRAQTAEWGTLDFSRYVTKPQRAARALEDVFKKSMARRCEGLVLKPAESPYLSLVPGHLPRHHGTILKFKADYIEGLGDTADFAVVGAYKSGSADMPTHMVERTRWTHFVLACLKNKDAMCRFNDRPQFVTVETVSRPAISPDDSLYISQRGHGDTLPFGDGDEPNADFDLVVSTAHTKPAVIFKRPFVVEVVGSAFDKPPSCDFQMLRHPRIKKVHDDRLVKDIVSYDELQDMAVQALRVPADLRAEEAQCLKRLREAGKPKRPGLYIVDDTPSSRATTQHSSSPQATGPKTPPSLASTRSSNSPLEIAEPVVSFRKPDLASSPIPDSLRIIDSQDHERPDAVSKLSSDTSPQHVRPTFRIDAQPSEQRDLQGLPGNAKPPTPKRKPSSPCRVVVPSKRRRQSDPMLDVENRRCPEGPGLKMRLSAGSPGATAARQSSPLRDISNSAARGWKQFTPRISQAAIDPDFDTAIMDIPARLRQLGFCPLANPHLARNPFEDCTVLLSPSVQSFGFLTRILLPRFFGPDRIATSLPSWRGFLHMNGHHAESSAAANVRNFEGLRKMLIIDRNHAEPAAAVFIWEVMRIRLADSDMIEIWDWRLFEHVARHPTQTPQLGRKLDSAFVGVIQPDDGTFPRPLRLNQPLPGWVDSPGMEPVVIREMQIAERHSHHDPNTTNLLLSGSQLMDDASYRIYERLPEHLGGADLCVGTWPPDGQRGPLGHIVLGITPSHGTHGPMAAPQRPGPGASGGALAPTFAYVLPPGTRTLPPQPVDRNTTRVLAPQPVNRNTAQSPLQQQVDQREPASVRRVDNSPASRSGSAGTALHPSFTHALRSALPPANSVSGSNPRGRLYQISNDSSGGDGSGEGASQTSSGEVGGGSAGRVEGRGEESRPRANTHAENVFGSPDL